MAVLTLDHFLGAGSDMESAQYRILSSLQGARRAFSKNIIYPHLSDLVNLYETLQNILHRLSDFRDAAPGVITGLDPETLSLQLEKPDFDPAQFGPVEELIEWALPLMQEAIEEGRTIFEFVDENLHLEEVGLVPSYVEEGYLLVPDSGSFRLHVLQYHLSIFERADERYRSLRTTVIKTIDQSSLSSSLSSVKLRLLDEYPEFPNPATYYVDSQIAFPFESTILPIAKRKLMRRLFHSHGQA